jgi:hypothetical protein
MLKPPVGILIAMGVVGAQPENTTDKLSIEAVVAQFMDAWNHHDAHAFAALFTEDADFTNVRGTHAHGRKAVEEFHAPMFATSFKGSHPERPGSQYPISQAGYRNRRRRLGDDGSRHSRRRCSPATQGIA